MLSDASKPSCHHARGRPTGPRYATPSLRSSCVERPGALAGLAPRRCHTQNAIHSHHWLRSPYFSATPLRRSALLSVPCQPWRRASMRARARPRKTGVPSRVVVYFMDGCLMLMGLVLRWEFGPVRDPADAGWADRPVGEL